MVYLKKKLGNLDMISFGPDIRDAHTPNENLSISSTEKCMVLFTRSIKKYKIIKIT